MVKRITTEIKPNNFGIKNWDEFLKSRKLNPKKPKELRLII